MKKQHKRIIYIVIIAIIVLFFVLYRNDAYDFVKGIKDGFDSATQIP